MYYTAPSATSSVADSYRNVMGSINLENIISSDDKTEAILKGDCCSFIGRIKPFMTTRITKSDNLNDIQKKVMEELKGNSLNGQGEFYGIEPEVRNLVENKFFWQAFMCF